MRVLVAEDDAVARLILRRALSAFGHECVVAASGEEAWEIHESAPADVIISDWLMPGISGVELCERVRASSSGAYTYFVFMTALGDKQHFLEGMQAGADDYLTKPVDLDELQARLIAATRVTSLHRRLHDQNLELERLSRLSHEAARTDPLTLAGNRLRLREDLEALRARATRYGHAYCAALCDVDEFKKYNDYYGHLKGDAVLKTVAETVRAELRGGDSTYRYGGEEFLVILPEQTLASGAMAMERVRKAIERAAIPHAGRNPAGVVTISVGLSALAATHERSTEEWLRRADEALYRAKASGKNRVVLLDVLDGGPAAT